jgi:MoxR-like ATPase
VTADPNWRRYRGDGVTRSGTPAITPGDRGRYLAAPPLALAVNTALAVEQPLLVTGEPGVGKTKLAWSIAAELELGPVLEFHTRSDHRARDVLFTVDHLRRFYHAQVHDPAALDIRNYIRYEALGEAIRSPSERVVLIDEIDKASRDFPNDLLDVVERMQFTVPDTGDTFKAAQRPIVIITSNGEQDLPNAFLRRCVFHHIDFPEPGPLRKILEERLADLDVEDALLDAAVQRFLDLRELPIDRKPSTAELLKWVTVLVRAGVDAQQLTHGPMHELPFRGVLLKSIQDVLGPDRV